MSDYQQRVSEIIADAPAYHQSYYEADPFRGPSLYFHRKALENRSATDFTRQLEYIYATLTAWGMHRMGSGGAKMLPFEAFHESMGPLTGTVEDLKKTEPHGMCEENWSKVAKVFTGIKIMASGTAIVGNSKVMAHLLPNLVPPIDRQYTLRYLRGNTYIRNGEEPEWQLMREILEKFFFPVCCSAQFRAVAAGWVADQTNFPWDTSILKVIDNLVIGAQKFTGPAHQHPAFLSLIWVYSSGALHADGVRAHQPRAAPWENRRLIPTRPARAGVPPPPKLTTGPVHEAAKPEAATKPSPPLS